MSLPKLLIVGHMRHGKDTFAQILVDQYGFTKKDSSRAACEIFLFEKLRHKYGYQTIDECYADRVNHRAEWHDEIKAFNADDKTKLARAIMRDNDIYVGMRSRLEIEACVAAGVFDKVVWVDASKRLPPEPRSSFDIDISCADVIIDNNGPEGCLEHGALQLMECLKRQFPLEVYDASFDIAPSRV